MGKFPFHEINQLLEIPHLLMSIDLQHNSWFFSARFSWRSAKGENFEVLRNFWVCPGAPTGAWFL